MQCSLAMAAEEGDVDESQQGVPQDSRKQRTEDRKWSPGEKQGHLPVSGQRAKYLTTGKGLSNC